MATVSTVSETSNFAAVRTPPQYCNFYAVGRYWVFYVTDNIIWSPLRFRSSINGIAWSDATDVVSDDVNDGATFSIWFDGTYVHYVRSKRSAGNKVYYRRGAPQAGGTITWSAVEQEAYDPGVGDWGDDPVVTVDSNGYPYIAFHQGMADDLIAIKSSTNDGTWVQDWAQTLYANATILCGLIPLTSGKVYCAYKLILGDERLRGRLWNGAIWEAEEFCTTSEVGGSWNSWSGVAIGDDIHIVFTKEISFDLVYVKKTNGVGWGAEATVQASTTSLTAPALAKSGADLYCFWLSAPTVDHVYYKKCTGGVWDAGPTDWIDESGDDFTSARCIQSSYEARSVIGVVYQTKTGSPYNVRHAILDDAPVAGGGGGGGLAAAAARVLLT